MIDKYADRIEVGDCWEWQGFRNKGYGKVKAGLVHRVIYETLVGEIPDGMELDHLCRNRGCCNPDHLEVVTHAENMRRAPKLGKGGDTHCKHGHPFDAANTIIRPEGGRSCRECGRRRAREYQRRRRGNPVSTLR